MRPSSRIPGPPGRCPSRRAGLAPWRPGRRWGRRNPRKEKGAHSRVRRFLLCAALAALTLICCTSEPVRFFIAKLDNQAKARALVDEGIQEYQTLLLRRGDLDKVAEVREFFVMALRTTLRTSSPPATAPSWTISERPGSPRPWRRRKRTWAGRKGRKMTTMPCFWPFKLPAGSTPGMPPRTDWRGKRKRYASGSSRKILPGREPPLRKPSRRRLPRARKRRMPMPGRANEGSFPWDPQNASAAGQLNALKVSLDQAAVRHASLVGRLIANAEFETARGEVSLLAAANRRVDGILGARLAAALYALDYESAARFLRASRTSWLMRKSTRPSACCGPTKPSL